MPRRSVRATVARSGSIDTRAAAALLLLAASIAPAIAAGADDPDYPHGEFRGDCSLCHAPDGWTPLQLSSDFDHAYFGMELEGSHRALDCTSCHLTLDFTRSPKPECSACHEDIHRGENGKDCASCHNSRTFRSFNEMTRNHQMTRFPLTGAHRAIDCVDCHSPVRGNLVYTLSIECVSCHRPVYMAARNPEHVNSGFPTDCESCHTTVVWQQARFDHELTGFPLNGAHRAVACESCHVGGVYTGTNAQCVGCHQADYDTTTNPNHGQSGFGTDCTVCHTTSTWVGGSFDHNLTSFPLDGAHRALTCDSCHLNGVYAGTNSQCVACHQADYDATTNPNHGQSGFGTDCTVCHTTSTWIGGSFDHNQTSFPLTGAHRAVSCDTCHADGVYAGKSTACFSCHRTEYETTTDPNHAQAGFPIDCQNCHTTSTWTGAQFDHDLTNFPLTGSHRALLCQDCHSDGVYAGKSTACVSCHQTDYDQTIDPNHRASGFSTTCETCHDTTNWNDATFDHDGAFFPIYSGKHTGKWQACSDCHVNPNDYHQFECIFCHRHSDRQQVDNDHSQEPGYRYDSQACYSCHPDGRV